MIQQSRWFAPSRENIAFLRMCVLYRWGTETLKSRKNNKFRPKTRFGHFLAASYTGGNSQVSHLDPTSSTIGSFNNFGSESHPKRSTSPHWYRPSGTEKSSRRKMGALICPARRQLVKGGQEFVGHGNFSALEASPSSPHVF